MSDRSGGTAMLPRPLRHAAIDCGAIFLVLLAATLSFGPVFGGTAYLVAGIGAGRTAPDAPLSNGSLAGLGALVLWIPLRVLIWAVRDASNSLFTGDDPVLSPSRVFGQAVIAVAFGTIGALVAARRARRTGTL